MSDNTSQEILDARAVLDALGQGVLLFDTDGRLIYHNHAAHHILGANLVVMRAMGWSACANLFDAKRGDGPSVSELRLQAFQQAEPVRFHAILSGAHISCWVTAVYGSFGQVYTMVTLERPDWTAFSELMSAFRRESSEAISSAQGHAELMLKILSNGAQSMDAEHLAERASGFAGMVATHLRRLEQFTRALYRLEIIRTDQLSALVAGNRVRVALDEFVEDYLEELGDQGLLDESPAGDFRERIQLEIGRNLYVAISPSHMKAILTDLLRNALMYSPPESRILLRAARQSDGKSVQLDVVDQGYGIRTKEAEKVFAPFQRARQPQVLAEFGYGISLHLVKAEIETMGGRIWYTSEEKKGTVFSLKLPS